MKILFVLNYGWEFGGGETSTLNLKRELERRGHLVKIFSSDNNPNRKHFSNYEFREYKNNLLKLILGIFNPKSYFRLKQVLKEFKPDIVHIRSIDSQVTSSILLCLKDIPTMMRINSFANLCPVGKTLPNSLNMCNKNFGYPCIKCVGLKVYFYSKLRYLVNKKMFKNVDLFEAVSDYMKKICEKVGFKPVKTVYNGINLSQDIRALEGGNNLLYVGRLSNEKGVEYLLNAMPFILKKLGKVHLEIVGDGPEKQNLLNLAKKLKVLRNVNFIGQVPNRDLRKHYNKANIVIFPSIYPEPFGNTGLEIMNENRPAIGTDVGGIPEWLEDGKTGYFVPSKDPKAIAEKAIYLLNRPNLMIKMGLAGRKKAEKEFNIKEQAKKMEKLYKEIIKNNKGKNENSSK